MVVQGAGLLAAVLTAFGFLPSVRPLVWQRLSAGSVPT